MIDLAFFLGGQRDGLVWKSCASEYNFEIFPFTVGQPDDITRLCIPHRILKF